MADTPVASQPPAPIGAPPRPRASKLGRIVITPYTVFENGRWFAALSFSLRGVKLGNDLVLRERPCRTADEALREARQYVQRVNR